MSQPLIDSEEVAKRARERIGLELSGKWTIERLLGIGGMAAVYAAVHRNKSRVAIKMLHAHFANDRVIVERFLKEGYAGNSVEHPGVIRVLDDGRAQDGAAFVVMDLLEGLTLEQLLSLRGHLPAVQALDFAIQALDILAAAHENGVVHRDIKPDNFFITFEGEVKLLDFGIARVTEHHHSTTVGTFMGTPAYASPEQAKGRWEEVDAQSDLWSLGATLFAALTGQQVHQAETSMEQLAMAVHAEPRKLEEAGVPLPQDVYDVVDQSLKRDKAERFADARVFQRALLQVESTLPPAERHLGDLCFDAKEVSHSTKTIVASSHAGETPPATSQRPKSSSSRRRRARASLASFHDESSGDALPAPTAHYGVTRELFDTNAGADATTRRRRKVVIVALVLAVLAGAVLVIVQQERGEPVQRAASNEAAGTGENAQEASVLSAEGEDHNQAIEPQNQTRGAMPDDGEGPASNEDEASPTPGAETARDSETAAPPAPRPSTAPNTLVAQPIAGGAPRPRPRQTEAPRPRPTTKSTDSESAAEKSTGDGALAPPPPPAAPDRDSMLEGRY